MAKPKKSNPEFRKLVVLDYGNASVNEYTIPVDVAKSPECVEEFIEDKGHYLDECQWMVAASVMYKVA